MVLIFIVGTKVQPNLDASLTNQILNSSFKCLSYPYQDNIPSFCHRQLKQWDLCGHTGHSHSLWSDSVASSYVASKATAILWRTLILMLQQWHNLIKSKTDTMPTTNWCFFLKRKGTLMSFHLMNVSVHLPHCSVFLIYLFKQILHQYCAFHAKEIPLLQFSHHHSQSSTFHLTHQLVVLLFSLPKG